MGTSHTASFLALPNELISRIIDMTRPFDFESVMLTCKRIYEVGQNLIDDHNFCKGWMLIKGGRMQSELVFLFHGLVRSPTRQQIWMLPYVTRFVLASWTLGSFHWTEILGDMRKNAPWLGRQLSQLSDDFPDLEQYREGMHKYKNQIDLFGEDNREIRYGPTPSFYHISSLFLFENLRQLCLCAMPVLGDNNTLTSLIKRLNGRRYFQQLEEVGQYTETSMKDVSGWLLLPKLKALTVCDLDDEDSNPRQNHNQRTFDWPLESEMASIEHFVATQASSDSSQVAQMLKVMTSLRSFTWEQAMKYSSSEYAQLMQGTKEFIPPTSLPDSSDTPLGGPSNRSHSKDEQGTLKGQQPVDPTLTLEIRGSDGFPNSGRIEKEDARELCYYYGDYISEVCSGKTVEEIRDQFWLPLADFQSIDVEKEEVEDILPISQLGLDENLLFNAQELVTHLATTQSDTLEHLVLSIHLYRGTDPIVLRRHQILNFKAFTKLTHLEIDIKLLKTKCGTTVAGPSHCNPQCLTDVLPTSIETFRLNVPDARFSGLYQMLRKLSKRQFPDLRHIFIRFVERGSPYEILTRMQLLQTRFRQIGILLELEEVPFEKLDSCSTLSSISKEQDIGSFYSRLGFQIDDE